MPIDIAPFVELIEKLPTWLQIPMVIALVIMTIYLQYRSRKRDRTLQMDMGKTRQSRQEQIAALIGSVAQQQDQRHRELEDYLQQLGDEQARAFREARDDVRRLRTEMLGAIDSHRAYARLLIILILVALFVGFAGGVAVAT